MNDLGEIAGYYIDSNNQQHSFMRDQFGNITPFHVRFLGDSVAAINNNGDITGSYTVGANSGHLVNGFVRHASGSVNTFRASQWRDTFPSSINNKGQIAGYNYYFGQYAAFLRGPRGKFTHFNVPGSLHGATFAASLNDAGQITGSYVDANNLQHAFVRDQFGNITTFDVPNTLSGTYGSSINASGQIAGSYCDQSNCQPFFRDQSGNITIFSAGASGVAASINASGEIAGTSVDGTGQGHAFLRDSSGNITVFDANQQTQGTGAVTINASGQIAGWYVDSANVSHGFYTQPTNNTFR
jgi:uncharacterized membrane protein